MRSALLLFFIVIIFCFDCLSQWNKDYEFSHQEPVFNLFENNGFLFTQNRFTFNGEASVGSSWKTLFQFKEYFIDAVAIIDPMTIILKVRNQANHHVAICKTDNGGISWTIDSLTFNHPNYSVICGILTFGQDTVLLSSASQLMYLSTDGGSTFDTSYYFGADERTSHMYNSVKIDALSAFWYAANGNKNNIYLTEDRGLTWRLLYTFDDHVVNFQRIADSLIYAVGRNGKFYISRDEGRSWTVNQIAKGRHMVNLHFIDKDTGYVCGGEPGLPPLYGFIYRTFDGGQTWTDVSPVDCRFQINALYFYDGYTGMAFSNYGETYRTTTGGGVGKAVTDLVSGDMAIGEATSNGVSVFPNPTSTTVEITWDFVSPSSSVLKLINIQGMELHSTSMDNRHRLTLNVRDLPVGVYLLQMDSPRGKVLKKFIISR
jgi:hypothetical protein